VIPPDPQRALRKVADYLDRTFAPGDVCDAMAVVSFAARMAWARIEALEETLYGQRAMPRDDR
jgi:hypothetical protein